MTWTGALRMARTAVNQPSSLWAPDEPPTYAAALAALGAGREGVLAALGGVGPGAAELASRVRENALAWDAITTWGSPALMI